MKSSSQEEIAAILDGLPPLFHVHVLSLALPTCSTCDGVGISPTSRDVCKCVNRLCFRLVHNRFRSICNGGLSVAPVSRAGITYARANEDFKIDFVSVSKRFLPDPEEWALFRYHFVLGADWKLCTKKLGIDRGTFFHRVYALENKLGRVYRTLKPYPLYPLEDYFRGMRLADLKPLPALVGYRFNGEPLRPPLAVAPAPEPVPTQPVAPPAPVTPEPEPEPADEDPVPELVRERFRAGIALRSIANDLARRGIPPPAGRSSWSVVDVRRVLLRA